MKIQITKNSTDITIDASKVNSLSELRSAIETALELEGYTKEDIDEVFNREQEAKKGNVMETLKSMADIVETQEHKDLVKQIMNGPKVEEQGTLTEDGRYYYPKTDGGGLLKECKHHKHSMSCFGDVAMIGSMACGNCMFNQRYNEDEGWIKCSKIKEVLGEETNGC